MNDINIESLTPNELKEWCIEASQQDLFAQIPHFRPEQLTVITESIRATKDPLWREKIIGMIKNLENLPQIEAVGKGMNLAQALEALRHHHEIGAKLSPLFVGISHPLFDQVLLVSNQTEFDVLRHEGMTEPIQHHLTLFTHGLSKQVEQIDKITTLLTKEIEDLNPFDISRATLFHLLEKIKQTKSFYEEIEKKAIKSLSLAWNTNRVDLIEKISRIKEICHYSAHEIIGHEPPQPSGLYLFLQNKLNAVYGSPDETDRILDDEPAIEALAKFSIWYLQHYWEIGLLPAVPTAEHLELSSHSEKERSAYRESLFKTAEENLLKLGLENLGDLKREWIYSRKSLTEFINENRDKITDSIHS